MTRWRSINWFKLNRSLHRDIGYFCIGMTIVFSISGIVLNHIHDWNANYQIERHVLNIAGDEMMFLDNQLNAGMPESKLANNMLLAYDIRAEVKASYWESEHEFKLFLKNGSTLSWLKDSEQLIYEQVTPRYVIKAFNFLHLNEGRNAWVYFSDLYACMLLFLSLSALFMVKGRRSPWGKKSIYVISGVAIPLVFILIGS